MATADDAGTIAIWDARDGTPLGSRRHGNQAYAAAFGPRGWVCSEGDHGDLDVWDARSGDLVARALLPGSVGSIAWTRADVLRVASHGSENGFRPVVYRFALHSPAG